MPNTPALVQCGASVYVPGKRVTDEDEKLTAKLLSSVGTAERVQEYLMDPITALSGSGPAYVSLKAVWICVQVQGVSGAYDKTIFRGSLQRQSFGYILHPTIIVICNVYSRAPNNFFDKTFSENYQVESYCNILYCIDFLEVNQTVVQYSLCGWGSGWSRRLYDYKL